LLLTFEKPFFICEASFAERKLPQKAGFRFDKESKRFFTSEILVASRLREHADERTRKILDRYLISIKPWTGHLRYPVGLAPLPFQEDAAKFALSRNRSYLWMDPGLGKTIVACLIMNELVSSTIIYVCPPFLCLNVEDEILKWTQRKVAIEGRGDHPFPGNVWIIPDSRLDRESTQKRFKHLLRISKAGQRSVVLFVDEAHRFKSEKSGRALYLLEGYAPKIRRQVWMSGTAMPNRPLELYNVLSKCAPETIDFMSRNEYGLKYCGGRWNGHGYDFKGATNVKELASKVIGTFMLRLKKSLLGLPPLTEELLIIGEELTPALVALDRELLKQFSPEDLMGYLAPNEHVSTYRKELGKIKAKAVLPYLKSLMEETDDHIIIATVHRDAIAILKAGLAKYNPAVIDGTVATDKRLGIAKAWQASKKDRLMLLNNIAGGLGFNLTKACRVVQVEFSWVYDENRQVFDRAHRYGQKNDVLVQYVVYKNSIDRKVIETAMRKKALGEIL
jgi:SWI/SNF-related matrix-associated actin-dependent regulator 1 of chromatin subfamily A